MGCWQYGQLTITVDGRALTDSARSAVWHRPGRGVGENYSDSDQTVVELLNRFGADGWELAGLQDYREGGDGSSYWEAARLLPSTPSGARSDPAAKSAEPAQRDEGARSATMTSEPDHPRAELMTGEAALVRVTAYWLPDHGPAGSTAEDRGSGSATANGRILIRREATRPRSSADIGLLALFRVEYEDPDISANRRDRINAAAADYAASLVEGQFGVTWWATPQTSVLPGSRPAEWLHGLAARPGRASPCWCRVNGRCCRPYRASQRRYNGRLCDRTADYAILEMPLACEVAGIVIGLSTGIHPLVMACAKRIAHDEAGKILSGAFERVLPSINAGHDGHPDADLNTRGRAPSPAEAFSHSEAGPSRHARRGNNSQTRRENPSAGERPRSHPHWPSERQRRGPARPGGDKLPPKPQPSGAPRKSPGPPGPGAPGPSQPDRPGPNGRGAPGV